MKITHQMLDDWNATKEIMDLIRSSGLETPEQIVPFLIKAGKDYWAIVVSVNCMTLRGKVKLADHALWLAGVRDVQAPYNAFIRATKQDGVDPAWLSRQLMTIVNRCSHELRSLKQMMNKSHEIMLENML
jgi:hypothetical protein